MTEPTIEHCALCGATEEERPLLVGRFDGRPLFFCPACMPKLIHEISSEQLVQRLKQESGA